MVSVPVVRGWQAEGRAPEGCVPLPLALGTSPQSNSSSWFLPCVSVPAPSSAHSWDLTSCKLRLGSSPCPGLLPVAPFPVSPRCSSYKLHRHLGRTSPGSPSLPRPGPPVPPKLTPAWASSSVHGEQPVLCPVLAASSTYSPSPALPDTPVRLKTAPGLPWSPPICMQHSCRRSLSGQKAQSK